MPESRLTRARATLPADYEFGNTACRCVLVADMACDCRGCREFQPDVQGDQVSVSLAAHYDRLEAEAALADTVDASGSKPEAPGCPRNDERASDDPALWRSSRADGFVAPSPAAPTLTTLQRFRRRLTADAELAKDL